MIIFVLSSMLGCANKVDRVGNENQPFLDKINYSNLSDENSKQEAEKLLKSAGVSEERINVLMNHIDQFNSSVSENYLTNGFETADLQALKYDPYDMQDEWMEKNPDFSGYNCRITAYSLFADFLTVKSDAEIHDDDLFTDLASLESDPSAIISSSDKDTFRILFSTIQTENTKDINIHAKKVSADWSEKGISFKDNDKMKLITVFFHDQFSADENVLFIGHAGILLFSEDGSLYFLEKVAFQEPYRALKFENRTQLSDYLMAKYDTAWNQPTAKPFIFENESLMQGYRPNQLDENDLQG
ncbi:MAG: DUF4300 family protein [Ruminococcus sp.]|nr:DUF4300 family protein [Ruminococcus sp.]